MDILQYIDKIKQNYGNEPVPVRYNTQKYLQGGRVKYQGGQLVDHGPAGVRQGYNGREGPLSKQIKSIYSELKKQLGRNPYVAEVMEKVTLDKSKTLNNKRANIKKVLKTANMELTPGTTTTSKETQIQKRGESIKQTKRVENFLPTDQKTKLFEEIKKYKKGTRVGPQQTMNIRDFAKYFPEGTKEHVISRQINRIAKEQGLEFKKVTKPEELEGRKIKEKIKKKGDPRGIAKKLKGTKEMPLHHMRAKGFVIDDVIKAISPSLADLTYIDIETNSVKLQNVEKLRNDIVKEQMELFERKPEGWQRRIQELNAKSRHLANKIPKKLKGLIYFEQMDEAGNLKAIGGNPMKSIGKTTSEGKIKFDIGDTKKLIKPTIKQAAKRAGAKVLYPAMIANELMFGRTFDELYGFPLTVSRDVEQINELLEMCKDKLNFAQGGLASLRPGFKK